MSEVARVIPGQMLYPKISTEAREIPAGSHNTDTLVPAIVN